jgi:hypothetical protein
MDSYVLPCLVVASAVLGTALGMVIGKKQRKKGEK